MNQVVTPVNKKLFYDSILDMFSDGNERTARETGAEVLQRYKIGDGTRQAVHPRLTELCKMRLLEESGKKYDAVTKKKVTLYRRKADKDEKRYDKDS